MRTAGRAFGASVGVAAAVASVIVGYLAIPEGTSSEDWARRVNAICEKNASELRHPLRSATDGLASLTELVRDPSNVDAVGADLTTTSHDIQDAADSYREVVGQIREIDRPDEAEGIEALLDTGSAFYGALDDIATLLVSASGAVARVVENPGDAGVLSAASEELGAVTVAVQSATVTGFPAYQAVVADLGLEQCAVEVAALPPISPSPSTGLDEAQSALARRWGFDPAECAHPGSPAQTAGVEAQINCNVAGLEGRDPFFVSFSNLEALRSWFGVGVDQVADCGSGQEAEYALPETPHPGRIHCFPFENDYRVAVMLTDALVAFAAEASGPIALERHATDLIARLDAD